MHNKPWSPRETQEGEKGIQELDKSDNANVRIVINMRRNETMDWYLVIDIYLLEINYCEKPSSRTTFFSLFSKLM